MNLLLPALRPTPVALALAGALVVGFGGGAHLCIGQHFADMEVKSVMHQLLRRTRRLPRCVGRSGLGPGC